MRTSASQFEAIVDFMERYGDINKPADGPQGLQLRVQLWTQLAEQINLDVTGDHKTIDKWKKVWSDFKLDTKQKAAKIQQSAMGTGGEPASRLVLTDLEQRVLAIIGPQSATGLIDLPEVGVQIPQPHHIPVGSEVTPAFSPSDIHIASHPASPDGVPHVDAALASISLRSVSQSPSLRQRFVSRSPLRSPTSDSRSPRSDSRSLLRSPKSDSRSPLRSPRSDSRFPLQRSRSASRSPLQRSRSASRSPLQRRRSASGCPTARYETPRRTPRCNSSRRANPRPTTPPPSILDELSARLHHQDRWRMVCQEFDREHFRLRERELEQQAVWQNMARECVDILRQFLNR